VRSQSNCWVSGSLHTHLDWDHSILSLPLAVALLDINYGPFEIRFSLAVIKSSLWMCGIKLDTRTKPCGHLRAVFGVMPAMNRLLCDLTSMLRNCTKHWRKHDDNFCTRFCDCILPRQRCECTKAHSDIPTISWRCTVLGDFLRAWRHFSATAELMYVTDSITHAVFHIRCILYCDLTVNEPVKRIVKRYQ